MLYGYQKYVVKAAASKRALITYIDAYLHVLETYSKCTHDFIKYTKRLRNVFVRVFG